MAQIHYACISRSQRWRQFTQIPQHFHNDVINSFLDRWKSQKFTIFIFRKARDTPTWLFIIRPDHLYLGPLQKHQHQKENVSWKDRGYFPTDQIQIQEVSIKIIISINKEIFYGENCRKNQDWVWATVAHDKSNWNSETVSGKLLSYFLHEFFQNRIFFAGNISFYSVI